MNFLDKFTTTHLPGTFKKALRYALRNDTPNGQRALKASDNKQQPSPEGNRIAKPKMTWQETCAWLRARAAAASNRSPTNASGKEG